MWAMTLALVFAVICAFNVVLWKILQATFVQNDINCYGYRLWYLLGDGNHDLKCTTALAGSGAMVEYPLLVVWFPELLYTLGGGHPWQLSLILVGGALIGIALLTTLWAWGHKWFALLRGAALAVLLVAVWFIAFLPYRSTMPNSWLSVFALSVLLLDGLVATVLPKRNPVGTLVFWILFVGACGPIVWFRSDMLTAAAIALACLRLDRHPTTPDVLIGLGAAIKLWLALLIASMSALAPLHAGRGRCRPIGFAATGFILGLTSLPIDGWARSASPLTWQPSRGFQMESVPATPFIFLRMFTANPAWWVELSEHNAVELRGPGIDFLLGLPTLLTAGPILLTVVLMWRLLRDFRSSNEHLTQATLLSMLAVMLATVISNKTLSTQYIQWLAGPLAALFVLGSSPWLKRPRWVPVIGLMIIALLTQYIYPWGALGIMAIPNGSGFESSTLVACNVLLVILAGFMAGLAWCATSRPYPGCSGRDSLS